MKPRVLMIAYACDPCGAGEHWLGWGWAEQAAQRFEVDLITTPKARENVQSFCERLGITPHFVPVSGLLRKLTENAGGSWLRKISWQKRVRRLALGLHRQKTFSVVHQTTFHTFRSGFLAAQLGVPSVWGPIAGGERVPAGFASYLGSARYSELSRNLVNRAWLHTTAVQYSLRAAGAIFVSNKTTLGFLPQTVRTKCQVVPPNALRPEDEAWPIPASAERTGPLKLLYVGNCVATRALPLVFHALARRDAPEYRLRIIGTGPALGAWKSCVASLRLANVEFTGRLPHAELGDHYRWADALVFPALRDSGGSAVLEAMARRVPVVCLDWAGPGEMLDEKSGIKIPVTNPERALEELAIAFRRLHSEPGLGSRLAQSARLRAEALFRWKSKRELLERTYQGLITR